MSLHELLSPLLLAGAVWLAYRLIQRRKSLSSLDKIPGPPSKSFFSGNIVQFFTRDGAEFQRKVALDYGPVVKIHGMFGRPMLYISDPKALHTIVIKEENIYTPPKLFTDSNWLLFGRGLLATIGDHHRKQRKMLNPVFSVNHMRNMLPIFYDVIHRLREAMAVQIGNEAREIDVLGWTGRTALELIGQGGLGYSFDPLTHSSRNALGEAMKALLPTIQHLDVLRRFLPYVSDLGPARFRRAIVEAFPSKRVQEAKEIIDTIADKSLKIFREKQAAIHAGDEMLLRQVGEGKDIMSILMKANMAAGETDRLSQDELIAQMSTLIFAAMDTISNALSRILQLLAEHPDIQSKLREECLAARAADYLSYDELNRLPLLDSVCRETLRLYPPATLSTRAPNKDVILSVGEPVIGIDGTVITEIAIPKGTEIIIGTLGCNTKKSLWGDDALEWKPNRWLSPLPSAVIKASIPGVYSNLMTFFGGKRACIGFKFSEMEMKVVLSVLLANFTFELTDKPIEWNVAGVWYPTVGKESNTPQLPLKVGLYKNNHS
ncbi:cytochrome P450 [Wolfiporia cocos MD-104 SS10]|uniref:Cytochrome P450 n=1 Tax=Wolfiporia cocos (strain MD-104) TaxID=742152 RepID=A0A2H3JL01_WOLCO|nr:cytochrome P450 [Wolfiporia cocos MD-104 SS10]